MKFRDVLIDKIPDDIKTILIDRLEAVEIVDFLSIPVEDIINCFEDLILDNYHDLLEMVGLTTSMDEEEDTDD